MRANSDVEGFVRGVLGCTCPDDVFDSIEIENRLVGDGVQIGRTVIGRRLLLYVWGIDAHSHWEEHLSAIVQDGVNLRDGLALNRFRLVLVTESVPAIAERAQSLFGEVVGVDEKAHVHVVAPKTVPDAMWSGKPG